MYDFELLLLHHGFTTIPATEIGALDPAFIDELYTYLNAKADHDKAAERRKNRRSR